MSAATQAHTSHVSVHASTRGAGGRPVPAVAVPAVAVSPVGVAVLAVGVAVVRVAVVVRRARFAAVGVSVSVAEGADAHQVDQ